jgi:cytochrome P450
MMQPDASVNIASPEFKANPFPYYKRLRDESPVHRVALPGHQSAWLVTRYDDVVAVLKDERFVKEGLRVMTPEQIAKLPWMPSMFKPLSRNMLDVDPPDHTRLRTLVQQAFSPRLVEGMRGRVAELADELLSKAARRGKMDLIGEYALPIPTTIIAEMLGIPVGDRHKFHRWSSAILQATAGISLFRALPPVFFFLRYLRKLVKSRRKNPRDDLSTALVQAHGANESLSDDELLSMIFLLIIAGHETTVNLIASGMLALMEHPDQLELLRSNPALIKSAVEELLRFSAPVETATERFALEDVELGGVKISKGEAVFAAIASANRDERQFANPDVLDITREPNKHLAFGQGIHFCLGASLARLEAQVAIALLLERTSDLRLAVEPEALTWRSGLVLRGLKSLPVKFTARQAALQRESAAAAR